MRRVAIAFDLDGTLAPSKTVLPDRMLEALEGLLEKYHVCVISGAKFTQFEKQILSRLKASPVLLERLHLMPTCGTSYYKYDVAKAVWEKVYAEDLTAEQKKRIAEVLLKVTRELGFEEKKTYGEVIEDRGSQLTLSVLGQDVVDVLGLEGVKLKEEWDADNSKKNKIRDAAAELLPDVEVRVGGLTSIDVTKPGIDKAYGMTRLMEILGISKDQLLFIGDRIMEGGNDYPVKLMGVDTLQVSRWEDTALLVEGITLAS